ncbi:hypothetical protein FRB91_008845 [Serendipita sp. 411]|nr:hypothetical protein FRB91_008845 [Serendipita sp. 411]
MGFFDTLGFDEGRYRRDHKNEATPVLLKKLKEKKGQIGRRAFGVGAGIGAAAFTGGISLVGTAYSARQISVIDQQCDIIKAILRERGYYDDSSSDEEGEDSGEAHEEGYDKEEYTSNLIDLSRNELLEIILPLLSERYTLTSELEDESLKSKQRERVESKLEVVNSKLELIVHYYGDDADVEANPKPENGHPYLLNTTKYRNRVWDMSDDIIEQTLNDLVEEERILTDGLEPYPILQAEIESDLAVIRKKRIILYDVRKKRKERSKVPPPLPARNFWFNDEKVSPVKEIKHEGAETITDGPFSSETFEDSEVHSSGNSGQATDDPYYWSSEILD